MASLLLLDKMGRPEIRIGLSISLNEKHFVLPEGYTLSWQNVFLNPPKEYSNGDSFLVLRSAKIWLSGASVATARIESRSVPDLNLAIELVLGIMGVKKQIICPPSPTPDSFVRGVANDLHRLWALIKANARKLRGPSIFRFDS